MIYEFYFEQFLLLILAFNIQNLAFLKINDFFHRIKKQKIQNYNLSFDL